MDPGKSGEGEKGGAGEERRVLGGGATPSRPPLVRTSLYFYGAMGIAALCWRMWTPGESILHPSAEAAARAWSMPAALGAGAGVGLLVVALSEGLTRFTTLGRALSDLLAESLGPLDRANALLLAFASGLAEEMFFRGALQPQVGLVGASLLFGAAHFLPRRELVLWSGFAVAIGLAFGALFDWTGQLAAPVAAHVVVNAINLPRLAARSVAEPDRVDLDPRT